MLEGYQLDNDIFSLRIERGFTQQTLYVLENTCACLLLHL